MFFKNKHLPSSSSMVKGLSKLKGVLLSGTVLVFSLFSVFFLETTFSSLVSICLCCVVTLMVVVIASGNVVGCLGGPGQRHKLNTGLHSLHYLNKVITKFNKDPKSS